MMRSEEEGWRRIGVECPSGRRSLWMRFDQKEGTFMADETTVSKLELCAGRDGDDAYIAITPSNPQFPELLGVFLTALYAAELHDDV